MKTRFEDLIPYCSENFITIPLWEEGDYRWQLNIWFIIEPNNDDTLEIITKSVTTLNPGFEVYIDKEHRLTDKKIGLNIGISQVCKDILDRNFVYNYNIEDYMRVGLTLIKLLEHEFKRNNRTTRI